MKTILLFTFTSLFFILRTFTSNAQLTVTVTSTSVSCNGSWDGTATANFTGGTSPFTYLWNNGQMGQTATGLAAGVYSVTVTDAIADTATGSVTVTQPPPITPSISASGPTTLCLGNSVTLTASGGVTYQWSTGNNTASINVSPSSTTSYTVSVFINNCSATTSATVNVILPPAVPVCLVSVDTASSKNVIVWQKPATTAIDSFFVYREIIGNYSKIGAVAYNDLGYFTDTAQGVNPNITSFRYKISALDTCGNESVLSAYHKTMHLQINSGVNLSWNDYEGFSFTYYKILRDTSGNGNWDSLYSVGFGTTSWTDISPPVNMNNNRYLIEVIPPYLCETTPYYKISRSNTKRSIDIQGAANSLQFADVGFQVYPNPNNGKFTLRITNTEKGMINNEVIINNVLGEKVFATLDINLQGSYDLDLSNHPSGIYYISVKSNENSFYVKLFKN